MNRTRIPAVVTVLAAMLLSMSGLALAESVKVSVSAGEGERNLRVTDLANAPLTELSLVGGVPTTFRVAVEDEALNRDQQAGFTVDATLNNLYLLDDETHVWEEAIPSSNVSVDYATTVPGVDDLLASVRPTYLLSTTGGVTCDLVRDLLGLGLGDLLALLGLGGNTLCSQLSGVELDDFPVVGNELAALVDIDLEDLLLDGLPNLPLIPGVGSTGAFDIADYANGIGAGHPGDPGAGTEATAIPVLVGELNGNVLSGLTDLVEGLLVGTPVAGTADSALVTTDTLISALLASGSSAEQALGDLLSRLSGSQQQTLLNSILEYDVLGLTVGEIQELTGSYHSFPRLTVDTGGATGGTYQGTLTLTLQDIP